jgi:predicted amidohydrolase YtcJ
MDSYLFLNGSVQTMEAEGASAPSCAVSGDRILGVGTVEEMKGLLGDTYSEIDMGGGVLFPGFVDCHQHLVLTAFSRMNLDLAQIRSIEELLSVVKNKIASSPPGKWILGLRFREDDYAEKRVPTLPELDSVSPENPVVLIRYDGHSALANSRALVEAKITGDTPDPEGGVIVREGGAPTGLLKELAVGLVLSAFPVPEVDEFKKGHEILSKELLSYGIVGVHSILQTSEGGPAGSLGPFEIPLFKLFEADIPQRVYPLIGAQTVEEAVTVLSEQFGAKKIDGMWRGGGMKLWLDGTFGSRTAYLFSDYADMPGERGMLVMELEKTRELIFDAQKEGLQMAIHAIGDRAVSELATLFLDAQKARGKRDLRHRIEHAGMIDPGDYQKLKDAGVICSVQPSFIVSEGSWIKTRVGDRLGRVYPLRSLLDHGVQLCAGSDPPVEEPHVLSGIWGTVVREGFTGDQSITPFDAISLYTREAAYASFTEETRGTITAGKAADLVLLENNPLTVTPESIRDIAVRMTMIGGQVRYEG